MNTNYQGKTICLLCIYFLYIYSSLSIQPMCQPKKFKREEAAPMADDDFLIAELNGHFQ
jgi:hypothetical protein